MLLTPFLNFKHMSRIGFVFMLFLPFCVEGQLTWTQKNDFPSARYYTATFVIGDTAYIGLGCINSVTMQFADDFFKYDIANDQWIPMGTFPGGKRFAPLAFTANGKGYVMLGLDSSNICHKDMWRYDPSNGTWEQKADFPGVGRYSASAFVLGNKAYVGLGTYGAGNDYLCDFWCYDVESDTWSQKANHPAQHKAIASTFVLNGKGYVCAGSYENMQATKDCWIYNDTLDQWTQIVDYIWIRSMMTDFVINGLAYVGLGCDYYSTYKTFYAYDPNTGLWGFVPSLPSACKERYGAAGFNLGSKGFFMGGRDEYLPSPGNCLADVWQLDDATGIKVPASDAYRIYPDPSHGWMFLQPSADNNSPVLIKIFDLSGKKLYQKNWLSTGLAEFLDLHELADGTYIMELERDGESLWTRQLVMHH